MAKKKPGKYDHILPTLPPFTHDAKKQDKIDSTVNLITKELPILTANSLTNSYSELRKRKAWLKKVLSDIELKLDAYGALMVKYYEVEGVSSIKLADDAGVRMQPEVYAKVQDREKFRLWCVANGLEKDLRLWPSTTQAVVRERLLIGLSEPDGTEATRKTKPIYMKGGVPEVDDSWLDEYEEFAELADETSEA